MTDLPEETPRTRTVDVATLLDLMRCGTLDLRGLLPWSSNYTFLAEVAEADAETVAMVVYKPQKGERPLWDFPQGTLYKREAAAYLVSATLGWNLVPPTVIRDGPHGIGSVQLFIDADYEQHYFTLKHEHPDQFQRMALFDIVINNADRKGGHVLLGADGHVWAIDHGIAFHDEYKLRTVIWDWVGQPIEADLRADLLALQAQIADEQLLALALRELLYPREIKAMRSRLDRLLRGGKFPPAMGQRSMPWPPV